MAWRKDGRVVEKRYLNHCFWMEQKQRRAMPIDMDLLQAAAVRIEGALQDICSRVKCTKGSEKRVPKYAVLNEKIN